MKYMKYNSAILIAILAICLTFTSKANRIGKRIVTACFEQVQLISANGSTYSPAIGSNCSTVTNVVFAGGFFWLNAVPSVQRTGCSPMLPTYCCIEFDVDPAAPAVVPVIVPQPGYAAGKYRIVAIKCRP